MTASRISWRGTDRARRCTMLGLGLGASEAILVGDVCVFGFVSFWVSWVLDALLEAATAVPVDVEGARTCTRRWSLAGTGMATYLGGAPGIGDRSGMV